VTAYDELVDGSTGRKKYHARRGTGTSAHGLHLLILLTAFSFGTFGLSSISLIALASPPRIHVHGTSTLDVQTARENGELGFTGVLRDDAGRALSGKTLRVKVSEGPEGPPLPVARCVGGGRSDPREPHGGLEVTSDDLGRFCVSVPTSGQTPYLAHFEWAGDAAVDGTRLDLHVDPSRRALALRFVLDDTKVIDLDRPTFEVDVTTEIEERVDASLPRESFLLTLGDERPGGVLGQARTVSGKAHFSVPRAKLGAPGQGELRVHFDGDGTTSPADRTVSIVRRATVGIGVPAAESGALRAGDPEDGVPVVVEARTPSGVAVTTGIVEATVDGRAVGSAPVEGGRAELVLHFTPDAEAKSANVELRYASDAPWYVPGSGAAVRLPIQGTGPLRRVLVLAASLGVVVWLALARRRVPTPSATKPERPAPTGDPGIAVLRTSKDMRLGWTGRVVDAHEGTGVAEADVRVERPSFTGVEILSRTTTDAAGRFELRCAVARKGDRLVTAARFHRTVERPLPVSGEIEVALVRRKRAVLERLVNWAKTAGGAYRGHGEPTPALVARADPSPNVGEWARAVEDASFGPDAVDADREEEVEKMAPHRR
jgi:hypothetical protein